MWCIDYAQTTRNKAVNVVSETFPHLEQGAMADFQRIMKAQGYWQDARWHETKHQYTFEGGTTLRFISIDTFGKAHGPRRDILFINECNNLPYNIVDQLITRTREVVWLDWNPSEEFWFYTDMQPNRDDIDFITLTYKDNEALDETTVREIESHRHNKNWWTVYGLGQLGAIETRIYRNWLLDLEDIPHEARLERYGLDFGYTNDPTAAVAVYYYNGGYILDEAVFQKGLSNKQIADTLQNHPQALVVADSAEPKSIDEIHSYGVNIIATEKGKDSVVHGIQIVQDQRISVTKRSVNVIKEYRNYLWERDRQGTIINEPEHVWSHSMDAIRYALVSIIKVGSPSPKDLLALEMNRRERVDNRVDTGIV